MRQHDVCCSNARCYPSTAPHCLNLAPDCTEASMRYRDINPGAMLCSATCTEAQGRHRLRPVASVGPCQCRQQAAGLHERQGQRSKDDIPLGRLQCYSDAVDALHEGVQRISQKLWVCGVQVGGLNRQQIQPLCRRRTYDDHHRRVGIRRGRCGLAVATGDRASMANATRLLSSRPVALVRQGSMQTRMGLRRLWGLSHCCNRSEGFFRTENDQREPSPMRMPVVRWATCML